MKKVFISYLLLIFAYSNSSAQYQKFNAGAILGLNFAQLTGEETSDYFGLNAGFTGSFRYSKSWQISMELLYSENGEYILPESYPDLNYGKIKLRHIEVPVHFDWLIDLFKQTPQVDWNIQFGIAYAYLFDYYAVDENEIEVTQSILYEQKDAYLLQLGTIYNFTEHLGVNFRANLPIRTEGLNWTLAGRLIYSFGV